MYAHTCIPWSVCVHVCIRVYHGMCVRMRMQFTMVCVSRSGDNFVELVLSST